MKASRTGLACIFWGGRGTTTRKARARLGVVFGRSQQYSSILTGAAEKGASRRELDGCHGAAVVAADRLALIVARGDLGRHD